MSQGALSITKAVPIIVVTWILSLVTTLGLVYVSPSIFPPLGASKIADGAIITTKLENGTVTSAKIQDGTITGLDLADGSIVTVKIADGAITVAKIADGAISSAKVADGAIVTVKLADNSITSGKLADNAVVAVKLADGAVTSAKILDGTIVAADIASGAVTTVKIADGAITTAKIADGAVTNIKLAAQAIPFNTTVATLLLSKTTSSFENITGSSVQLTVERNSTLLIMFSTQASVATSSVSVLWVAMVNATTATPSAIYLQPADTTGIYWTSVSYNFFAEVTPGQYTIYMQWSVFGSNTAWVGARTLIVVALPE